MFNPAELRKHLDTLTYDKYYQDIEILSFEGYSKSFETWDRIQSLGIDWRNKSVCDLGCFHGYFSFKVEQMGADTILGLDQGIEVLEFSNKLKVLSSSKVEFSVWRGGQTTPTCDIALVLNILHHCADQRETLVNINCEYAVFEVNTEQIPLISEYFDILKQTQGRIEGSGFRQILYAIKKRRMIYRLNPGSNLVFILGMVREGVENQIFFEFMNYRGFFDVLNEYKEHCFEIESTVSCDLNIWCGSFSLIERISIEPKHQVCRQDFAVIISMYNTQDFILRALDSILQQSIVPNEIVVVDDASTDESVQVIIEKYGNNKKIKLLKNKIKVGPFLNKNRVMKVLKEKYSYFAFLDSDDFILHETFSEMFHMIGINQNVKIVFPHMFRMENGTIYNFTKSNTRCCLAGLLLRADLLDEIGYFEPLKYGADGGFYYRCQKKLKSDEMIEVKQPLYRAEIRLKSLTNCDSYVNLDESSENYLSQDRQMYVDFFIKEVNKRITYMNSFGIPKKMLAVPIFFSEDVTNECIIEGLILNKKYFDLALVSIDMVIECLQLIGSNIFIDFNFQKTVAEDPKWLAFWRV